MKKIYTAAAWATLAMTAGYAIYTIRKLEKSVIRLDNIIDEIIVNYEFAIAKKQENNLEELGIVGLQPNEYRFKLESPKDSLNK